MAKEIKLTIDEKEYILKFTLRTVQQLSREGFNSDDLLSAEGIAMNVPKLICGSFKAKHPKLADAKIMDDIYPKIPNKDKFLEALSGMYSDVIKALVEDADEESEGNVQWEMTE